MSTWVDSVYRTMTVEEKVGQLFMPVIELNERGKAQVATYIQNQKIGGILFGKGTLSSQAEIARYAQQISKIPLFIALDGEWGLSMRLADAPQFPRNEVLGAITNDALSLSIWCRNSPTVPTNGHSHQFCTNARCQHQSQ